MTSRVVLFAYYVLPDLDRLNLKMQALHHIDVSALDLSMALAYGYGYVGLLLVSAVMIFNRRELL